MTAPGTQLPRGAISQRQPVQGHLDQAAAYLEALMRGVDGFVEVRTFAPHTRPEQTFHTSVDDALQVIQRAAAEGRNVYVGVASRRSTENGSKANLEEISALFVDRDFRNVVDQEAHEKLLGEFPVPPSIRVASGGGEHLYWPLKEPFGLRDPENVARFERILKGVCVALNGDRAATDASRIMRVPGTVNYPDERKRAGGRVETACTLISLNSDRTYSLEDFADFEIERPTSSCVAYEPARWDGELPDSVKRQHRRVRRMLTQSCDDLEYPSESEADLAVANMLAHRDINGADIESALRWRRKQVGAEAKHDGYFPLTVGKALGGARADKDDAVESDHDPSPQLSHLTDLGNAERLVLRHGKNLRFCHLWGRWLFWDGTCWRQDETGEVMRRAADTVASIYAEAAAEHDPRTRREIANHARRSESGPRIREMTTLARSQAGIPILPDQLDADPWLLNCLNGTLDLRTGELLPHLRENLLTKMVPVRFDATARCERFLRFLKEILHDPAVRRFLQSAVGYLLTGHTVEQVLFLLWGHGANGKTTLLEILFDLLGDYSQKAPAETFLTKRGTSIPNDVARLRGARLVLCQETEEGGRLAEAKVKELTGGDTISARFMRGEWFDFKPVAKFLIGTNHKPVVRGGDHAIWRRLRLIPFTFTVTPERRDPHLSAKLAEELPGILAWAVEGCLRWQKDGLAAPPAVLAATEGYREEQDTFGAFLDERCVQEPGAWVATGDLYTEYTAWCGLGGEKPVSQQELASRLEERGFTKERCSDRKRTRGWLGIRLVRLVQREELA